MKKHNPFKCLAVAMFSLSLTVLSAIHVPSLALSWGIIPPPPTYTWSVKLTDWIPVDNCTFTAYYDHASSPLLLGTQTVNRGGSAAWVFSYLRPPSMVTGYCTIRGSSNSYALLGKYCDGRDIQNGESYTAHSCKNDVSVYLCPKGVTIPDFKSSGQLGFCQ